MPELPEVETIWRGLEPVLLGRQIARIDLHRPNLRFAFPDHFVPRLTGAIIHRLSRRAKYMLWHFNDGQTLLLHLEMSGRFTLAKGPLEKHDHVVFVTDQGTEIRYNDPRRFGFMDLIAPGETSKFLTHLGPEPLGNDFNAAYLHTALQKSSAPLKARLLDQNLVVGVGNIYCCEALYQAGLSPARKANQVTQKQAHALVIAIRDVLSRAIRAGGSSLRDYVKTDGNLGYFQHDWRVYGRENKPCVNCKTPIERLVQLSRSSFFCPTCQL